MASSSTAAGLRTRRSRPAGVTDRNELDRLCNEYAAAWNARHPE